MGGYSSCDYLQHDAALCHKAKLSVKGWRKAKYQCLNYGPETC